MKRALYPPNFGPYYSPSLLFHFPILSFTLRAVEGARANNAHIYTASLCAYSLSHTHTHAHIYTFIIYVWLLFLSFSLPAHFCPTIAARATDNVISIYIYASDRPRLSRYRRYRVRHFGIASRIFPPGSCLFDKVIAL